MATTITLHRISFDFMLGWPGNTPAHDEFFLEDQGSLGDHCQYRGASKWILPEGYTVQTMLMGDLGIYGPDGRHRAIVCHRSGYPQLIGIDRHDSPVLKAAEEICSTIH